MITTTSKKLTDALQKAMGVGTVEEPFSIGDCEVVLRNLRPDEYESVMSECSEHDDLVYINKWQEGHVCRAIVELNGTSLRDIEFVECEEPDPKKPGQMRTLKRELHDWLRKNIVSTWGKEALYTAYRKFTDVVSAADEAAKKGITFRTPDETAEERFRRLAAELRDLAAEVPPGLVELILNENGFDFYRALADRAALDKIDSLAVAPDAPPPEEPPPAAPAAPAPPAPPPAPSAPPPPAPPPPPAVAAANSIRRRPMNLEGAEAPPPPVSAPAALQLPPAGQIITGPRSRSLDLLAQEAEFDPEIRAAVSAGSASIPPHVVPVEIPLLEKPGQEHSNPAAFSQVVEQKPVSGLNPKFRPPPR